MRACALFATSGRDSRHAQGPKCGQRQARAQGQGCEAGVVQHPQSWHADVLLLGRCLDHSGRLPAFSEHDSVDQGEKTTLASATVCPTPTMTLAPLLSCRSCSRLVTAFFLYTVYPFNFCGTYSDMFRYLSFYLQPLCAPRSLDLRNISYQSVQSLSWLPFAFAHFVSLLFIIHQRPCRTLTPLHGLIFDLPTSAT